MSCFIRKGKSKSGATTVQVVFKHGRKVVRLIHIGSAHTETELAILMDKAAEVKAAGQLRMELFAGEEPDVWMERAYSGLLRDTLASVYSRLGFPALEDEVFKQLVVARVIEPTSKLDTIRVLDGLGLSAPSNSEIHRALKRASEKDYRGALSTACLAAAPSSSLSLVLYDVTTLYFEIQKEDEYRRPGLSKERRLEPQITVGLLVDRNGFPLGIQSFEGNKAETKTIVPVLRAFSERHGLSDITVVADAAMLSGENLTALEELGYRYIVGSRLAKTPYEIAEYLKEPGAELTDSQIFDTALKVTIAGRRRERRVIYQYRAKRAALDLSNIEKTLAKALRMIDGTSEFKRNRFLKVTGATREINRALVEEARRKAGIKGYVTNLDVPAAEVIAAYHQLFQVEKAFRMAKSDLKARPVFHHKREAIEAHLTVVFAALAVSRFIEARTGISVRKFVRQLSEVRTGVISVNGVRHTIRPKVPPETATTLAMLNDSGCGH